MTPPLFFPDDTDDAQELAIVAEILKGTPWASTIVKAQRLLTTHKVSRTGHAEWCVRGDTGTHYVHTETRPSVCTCTAASFRPHIPCSHRCAVEIAQRCLAGGRRFTLVHDRRRDNISTHKETTMSEEQQDMGAAQEGSMAMDTVVTEDMPGEAPAASQSALPSTVYRTIARVAGIIARAGVKKTQEHQQGWMFRGIVDLKNAMAPVLAKEGLVILPRVLSCVANERQARDGKLMIYTTLEVEYLFVDTESGGQHAVKVCGEAMDFGDKSTSKAMTFAYKTMLDQVFCIPFSGTEDPEHGAYDVMPKTIQRAVPEMTPRTAAPAQTKATMPQRPTGETDAADYRVKIEDLLKEMGKTETEIDEYVGSLKAKYATGLEARLPSLYKQLQEKAARQTVATTEGVL